MKILITGSEGFIGKHLAEGLSGHELVLMDKRKGEDVRVCALPDADRDEML